MKKSTLFIFALMGACAAGAQNTVLDLTKAQTNLEFDADNGAWTETYNEDVTTLESQCFSFVKGAMTEYKTWWGFTASNSANNAYREDFIAYQFSNMAKGGIALNEDGTVKTDEFGAPVVDAAVPYLVAYYSPWMGKRPVDLTFNDGQEYEAVETYINLNSYAYYGVTDGLAPGRAFTNGDKLTLTIHGVAKDETEKTVDVELASYENGNLTVTRGWRHVDLSPLGAVNEIYFTMTTTDSGVYGDNTPEYFCMDKLTVKPLASTGVESLQQNKTIGYDRDSQTVTAEGFAAVFDTLGNRLMTSENGSFSIAGLPAGVYIVRCGNNSLKIAR